MNAEEIKTAITEANMAYRSGKPTMTDQEYDDLLERYGTMVTESEYSELRDSLNEGAVEGLQNKVTHRYVAGSLDKIKAEEPESVVRFLKRYVRNELCISAKIDGLSGIAKYENGRLVGFSTRGDGKTGVNIFNKARFIKFLPNAISDPEETYVRGELVILEEDYDKIDGTSARNVVAGLVNRKDFDEDDIRNVSFVSYTVMGPKYTKREQFGFLERNGFRTAWHTFIPSDQVFLPDDVNDMLFRMASDRYGMKTDGLVICDSEYRNEEKYRPDSCAAYKINQQTFETRLVGVDWQGPSQNGKFTPVGLLEPVEIGGVVVSKATLNNIDFIEELGVRVGDTISVLRSGDVIPKITSVKSTSEDSVEISVPSSCPCCGSELVREGPFVYCKNEDCEDKTVSRVERFIVNLGIENASFRTLKNFGITTFGKLLSFVADGKRKNEKKLENELRNKMFSRSKRELFCAIGMKDLAEKTLNAIVDYYSWEAIESREIGKNPFSELPCGIGDITMNKFLDGYTKSLDIVRMITEDFRYSYEEGVKTENNAKEKNGMSICFTGKLNTMGRSEASKLAERAGFEVKTSVTRGLTYLCTNDTSSGTSKNRKAMEFGTRIITEEEFLSMVKGNAMSVDEL